MSDRITLRSESCSAAATDYEIYRGDVGEWETHVPASCSTGGATSATVISAAGDHYFLVVPVSLGVEGGYGVDSTGQPRPRSMAPCVAYQAIGGCDWSVGPTSTRFSSSLTTC